MASPVITKGTPVYTWGVDDTEPAGGIITAVSLTRSYANVATAVNGAGDVIGKRMDDVSYDGSMTIQYESAGYTTELMGAILASSITIDGSATSVYITGVSESHSNSSFREVTYTVRASEYITLA